MGDTPGVGRGPDEAEREAPESKGVTMATAVEPEGRPFRRSLY